MKSELGIVTPLFSPEGNDIHKYFVNMATSVLAQNCDFVWDVIVDGPVDKNTDDFLSHTSEDSRVNIHRREKKPQDIRTASNALNEGFIRLLKNCEYFAYVHADDILTQDSLVSRLKEIRKADMVYGRIGSIGGGKVWTRRYHPKYDFYSTHALWDDFPHHTSMWSKRMIELMIEGRSGELFDSKIACGEDLDVTLYSRNMIKQHGFNLGFADQIVYLKVEHDRNITYNLTATEKINQLREVHRKNGYIQWMEHIRRPFFWLPERIKSPLRPLQRIACELTKGHLYPSALKEWTNIDPYWFKEN